MISPWKVILITFFILIALFPITSLITSFYEIYLKDYKNEIDIYLEKNNLRLVRSSLPSKKEWNNSPFKKPKPIRISFLQIRVLGFPLFESHIEHKILWCMNDENQIIKVWMELKTSIFSKPIIDFEIEK